jgi:hypothetical protein
MNHRRNPQVFEMKHLANLNAKAVPPAAVPAGLLRAASSFRHKAACRALESTSRWFSTSPPFSCKSGGTVAGVPVRYSGLGPRFVPQPSQACLSATPCSNPAKHTSHGKPTPSLFKPLPADTRKGRREMTARFQHLQTCRAGTSNPLVRRRSCLAVGRRGFRKDLGATNHNMNARHPVERHFASFPAFRDPALSAGPNSGTLWERKKTNVVFGAQTSFTPSA